MSFFLQEYINAFWYLIHQYKVANKINQFNTDVIILSVADLP